MVLRRILAPGNISRSQISKEVKIRYTLEIFNLLLLRAMIRIYAFGFRSKVLTKFRYLERWRIDIRRDEGVYLQA